MATDVASLLEELLQRLDSASIAMLGFLVDSYAAQQLILDHLSLVNDSILARTGPGLGAWSQRPQAKIQSACFGDSTIPSAVAPAFFPGTVFDQGQAWLNRIFTARNAEAGNTGEPAFESFMGLPKLANLTQAHLG